MLSKKAHALQLAILSGEDIVDSERLADVLLQREPSLLRRRTRTIPIWPRLEYEAQLKARADLRN